MMCHGAQQNDHFNEGNEVFKTVDGVPDLLYGRWARSWEVGSLIPEAGSGSFYDDIMGFYYGQ